MEIKYGSTLAYILLFMLNSYIFKMYLLLFIHKVFVTSKQSDLPVIS